MRIGSLFSGAGGLDMAVQAVFGGEVVWHSEVDKAASKVLAYRFPDVPNLGDITQVDWVDVPAVDVLCGGFPCQDVSAAGKRAGIKDGTRSGLWSVFAEAIDALRPQYVVIENVRGLLNANANRPLGRHQDAVGYGGDGPVLRAIGAVLGDISDIGRYEARWHTMAAADVGAPHRRERVFIVATATDDPRVGWDEGRPESARLVGGFDAAVRSDEHGVALLPTPCAQQSGNSPQEHLRKKPGRKVVTDLAILVENGLIETGGALLPTPSTHDKTGARSPQSIARMDKPFANLNDTVMNDLLPTPTSCDYKPTDSPSDLQRHSPGLGAVSAHFSGVQWGKYAPAIARWERVVGPAPAPTEPNKNGNPRLSAEFSQWLMGWPAGWVTDPDIGISRNDQLRIVGNGVCPQQAHAAIRYLLTVCEVDG